MLPTRTLVEKAINPKVTAAITPKANNGLDGLSSFAASVSRADGVTVEASAVGALDAGAEGSMPYFAGPMMGAKSTGQPAVPDR